MFTRIIVAVSLIIAFAAAPVQAEDTPFSTSILEGTWPGYALETTGDSAFTSPYASNVFQSDGDLISGSFTYPDGNGADFNGGGLVLSSTGKVSGRFAMTSGRELSVKDGKMAENKEAFALTYSSTDGAKGIYFLLEQTSDFEEKDFEDEWVIMAVETDQVTIKPKYLWAKVKLNDEGEFKDGEYEYMESDAGTIIDGDLNITTDGRVVGSLEMSNNVTLTFTDAYMTNNNKTIAGMLTHSDGMHSSFLMVKREDGHGDGDLDGNWFSYFAETMGGANYTPYGTFRMDDSEVESVTLVYQNGSSISLKDGDFDVEDDGDVSGEFKDDNVTYTIYKGIMDDDKGLMAIFYSSSDGRTGYAVMVRESDDVDDDDDDDDDGDSISGCSLSPKAGLDCAWLLLMALPLVSFLRRRQ